MSKFQHQHPFIFVNQHPYILIYPQVVSTMSADSLWASKFYVPVACFLLFNVGDYIGRYRIQHIDYIGRYRIQHIDTTSALNVWANLCCAVPGTVLMSQGDTTMTLVTDIRVLA